MCSIVLARQKPESISLGSDSANATFLGTVVRCVVCGLGVRPPYLGFTLGNIGSHDTTDISSSLYHDLKHPLPHFPLCCLSPPCNGTINFFVEILSYPIYSLYLKHKITWGRLTYHLVLLIIPSILYFMSHLPCCLLIKTISPIFSSAPCTFAHKVLCVFPVFESHLFSFLVGIAKP